MAIKKLVTFITYILLQDGSIYGSHFQNKVDLNFNDKQWLREETDTCELQKQKPTKYM